MDTTLNNNNDMSENKYFINIVAKGNYCITFAPTVPVLHTVRSAGGSFFLYSYGK